MYVTLGEAARQCGISKSTLSRAIRDGNAPNLSRWVHALTAGTMFWPWAQQNPLVRPVLALSEASHFQWQGDMLFAGRQVAANALPWMPFEIQVLVPFTT